MANLNFVRNARFGSGHRGKTRNALTTMRHLNEVERDSVNFGNYALLRVREETAEDLFRRKAYEEAKSPFDEMKRLCTLPKRKRKSYNRKRALEISVTMAKAEPQQRPDELFKASSAPAVDSSSASFTSASTRRKISLKNVFRRYSIQPNCATSDRMPATQVTRSARSFIGEQYRSVETF